jgi:methylglutaconyl-CoA hydratase
MREIKKMLWHGTEHWDTLLKERASISGRLILGEHGKKMIEKFKTKSA